MSNVVLYYTLHRKHTSTKLSHCIYKQAPRQEQDGTRATLTITIHSPTTTTIRGIYVCTFATSSSYDIYAHYVSLNTHSYTPKTAILVPMLCIRTSRDDKGLNTHCCMPLGTVYSTLLRVFSGIRERCVYYAVLGMCTIFIHTDCVLI